eukprot:3941266-Rhodomonas_salina.1
MRAVHRGRRMANTEGLTKEVRTEVSVPSLPAPPYTGSQYRTPPTIRLDRTGHRLPYAISVLHTACHTLGHTGQVGVSQYEASHRSVPDTAYHTL